MYIYFFSCKIVIVLLLRLIASWVKLRELCDWLDILLSWCGLVFLTVISLYFFTGMCNLDWERLMS
jgi:predicted Abi (CAAX) family protease